MSEIYVTSYPTLGRKEPTTNCAEPINCFSCKHERHCGWSDMFVHRDGDYSCHEPLTGDNEKEIGEIYAKI